ncbi:hypothetical protein PV327_003276 [Microctonus hyperodae]|uniref:protein-serine/threonine phosphatase n=1 Tax=Microctonus hyperodae TaxID=165561 RepID=A0AA39G418_MICHY|nr:hypothetical protein PV327_003276 [Microctonus hyperodae]
MGPYNLKPVTTKNSTDTNGNFGKVGTCSMQGWRHTQEDAHCTRVDYDDNTSFFAVFDGHGGHEVATYAAEQLPNFIKQTDAYKRGDIKQALIDGYLKFDAHLTEPETVKKLEEISLINITEKPKDKYGVEIDKDDDYDSGTDVVTKGKWLKRDEKKSETSNEKINDNNEKSAESDNAAKNDDEIFHECKENKSENNVESSKTVNMSSSSEEVVDKVPPSETKSEESSSTESDDDYMDGDEFDEYLRGMTDTIDDDDDDDDKVQVDETADQSEIDEQPGYRSGCTAVVAILKGNDLYVANAGDSRCVLCRNGRASALSRDHKPFIRSEIKRIINAGGFIANSGRINNGLNLARALGDHSYKKNPNYSLKKQMITALPDVRHTILDPERDTFMILACDGIWEIKSNKEVVKFIKKRINSTEKLSAICETLFDECLARLSNNFGCDNMTAVLVKFDLRASINGNNVTEKIDNGTEKKVESSNASSYKSDASDD